MTIAALLFGVWLGGAIQSALWVIQARSWRRVEFFGAIFLILYWLPLAIEALMDPDE